MAVPQEKVNKIGVAYKAGQYSKTDIAKKFKITRQTLNNLAEKNGWEYQELRQDFNESIRKKEQEHFIKSEADKRIEVTAKFLRDVEEIEALNMQYIGGLSVCLTKQDVEKNFSFLKSCKIAMETLNIGYLGKRKALRMDDDTNTTLNPIDVAKQMVEMTEKMRQTVGKVNG
jgi:DNA-binding XRE family transcriptional regulator